MRIEARDRKRRGRPAPARRTLAAALAAAVLATSAVPGAAAPTPEDYVREFEAACVPGRFSLSDTRAAATAERWLPAIGTETAMFAAAISLANREFIGQGTGQVERFKRRIGGREIYLLSTSADTEAGTLVTCTLYDFGARVPLGPELVEDWLGEPPTDSFEVRAQLIEYVWEEPGEIEGVEQVLVQFIPEGSPYFTETRLRGQLLRLVTLAADAE